MTACSTIKTTLLPPPKDGEIRGPHGSWGHTVWVEANEPGARIEVNKEFVGLTPTNIVLYGDRDRTFRGGMDTTVILYPPGSSAVTNLFVQTKQFSGGGKLGPEERVPAKLYFDLRIPPGTKPGEEQTINQSFHNTILPGKATGWRTGTGRVYWNCFPCCSVPSCQCSGHE